MVCRDLGELADKLPQKVIILEQVLHWMDLGSTAEEIAGSYRVSIDTLNARLEEMTGFGFSKLKERVCGQVKVNVRRNQYRLSEKNATMAIWLGKVWLGQRDPDKSEVFLISNEAAAGAMQQILDKTKNPLNTIPPENPNIKEFLNGFKKDE